MTPTLSDEKIERFLAERVKGLIITPAQLRAHATRPQNAGAALSDQGPTGSRLALPAFRPPGAWGPVFQYVINVYDFATALQQRLQDAVAGYCLQIRQQGVPIIDQSWQSAKTSPDASEAWTPDVQMHVASVSKLITAMAMTTLFERYNISPDAQIINYLPDYWVKGGNIEYITFRNLLQHTSGLTGPDIVSFDVMKSAIAGGISLDLHNPPRLGHYDYQNLNYALCRILLPVINGTLSRAYVSPPFIPFDTDTLWDLVTIAGYQDYTTTQVFRPANVFAATLSHPNAAALAYPEPTDHGAGWNSGDLSSSCGGDGWHLSVNELLNVMSAFRRDRSIVSSESAQAMLDNVFGVDPLHYPVADGVPIPAGLATPAGVIYCKNGRWMDNPTDLSLRREEQCLAFFLPKEMELALFVNSRFPVKYADDRTEPTLRDVVTQLLLAHVVVQIPVLLQ